MDDFSWASYWRNSLADAESCKGTLKDNSGFVTVDVENFATGRLPEDTVNELFKDENDKTQLIQLICRPSIFKLKKEHGKKLTGFPEVISPLICPLWLNRQGYLFPSDDPTIPRDLLSPQDGNKFTLGTVENLDQFLSTYSIKIFQESDIPLELTEDQYDGIKAEWSTYQNHCRNLYKQVCTENLNSNLYSRTENSQSKTIVWLSKREQIDGTIQHLLPLYDAIINHKPDLPLLQSYAQRHITNYRPCIDWPDSVALRTGHPSNQYFLADAQRDALTHAISMDKGEIQAVNGPPGTGKTTFILSVVASLWVNAALKETEPPVIVAASTNNQAVTNIIDAFGKDFSEGEDALSGRWLPEISSYGAYFPARYLEKGAQDNYQTKYFFEQTEQLEYIERSESYFLEKAAIAFSELTEKTLEAVCEQFHEKLESKHSYLNILKETWHDLQITEKKVFDELGINPDHTITELSNNIQSINDKLNKITDDLNQWLNFLVQESIWLFFRRKKRRLKRRLFIINNLSNDSVYLVAKVKHVQIEQLLTDFQAKISDELKDLKTDLKNKQALIDDLHKHETQWDSVSSILIQNNGELPKLDICDKTADIEIRFFMFRLAVHYWEARWLLSCKKLGNNIESQKNETGAKVVEPRWRRRMMLTPCIVSTFHSLPDHMTCTPYNERGFKEPLFNFVDLLIVDEAGQVSPEVAGASFALAKKALVIGDTHQIEPVRKLTGAIDIGNLSKQNIISNKEEYEQVLQSGRSIVNGSVMRIAQSASFYHYIEDMEPGMFLLEHRRCYDEIISFCNELCYKGTLIPKRGKVVDDDSSYPAFGYLHIDGYAEQRLGGSRFNQLEAETIAAWLNENREKLESTYQTKLEKIVGIVTPFTAQVDKIQKACNRQGIKTGKRADELTVGTIHALQGAERNLVIFSPVYSRHNDGSFIDRTSSMLNVAVSRAKDSFLVFGDMDVISAVPSSQPRGLLAQYLFKDKNNELVFSLGERSDLLLLCGKPKLINNAEQHDAYLFELLSQVENKADIVSPWVNFNKLKQTGLLEALKNACDRYVEINLYTDHQSNTTASNKIDDNKVREFESCCEKLSDLGMNVFVIKGLHSKLVMADNKYFCVGSFNWLSAARSGKYANMETSCIYSGNLSKEIESQQMFLQNRGVNRKYLANRKIN
jgi:hypothetical protein